MRDREYYIGDIRGKIPYLSDKQLSLVSSFIRGFRTYGYSNAESCRPVLTVEQQKQADTAASAMISLACAVSHGDTFGVVDGDIIIADAKKVASIYRESGWKRIARATLFQHMENAGYILRRSCRPKTAMVNNEKREVLYIPVEQLKPFIRTEVRYD